MGELTPTVRPAAALQVAQEIANSPNKTPHRPPGLYELFKGVRHFIISILFRVENTFPKMAGSDTVHNCSNSAAGRGQDTSQEQRVRTWCSVGRWVSRLILLCGCRGRHLTCIRNSHSNEQVHTEADECSSLGDNLRGGGAYGGRRWIKSRNRSACLCVVSTNMWDEGKQPTRLVSMSKSILNNHKLYNCVEFTWRNPQTPNRKCL